MEKNSYLSNIFYVDVFPELHHDHRHWVNSVSDIYGQDEIEELLQDLNRLELATLDTEKFQANKQTNKVTEY